MTYNFAPPHLTLMTVVQIPFVFNCLSETRALQHAGVPLEFTYSLVIPVVSTAFALFMSDDSSSPKEITVRA
jgi:hypothetical protein